LGLKHIRKKRDPALRENRFDALADERNPCADIDRPDALPPATAC
jgi:hypothetical protein